MNSVVLSEERCSSDEKINPILLVEGNPYKTELNFDPMAIKGALVSAEAIWYIPVMSKCHGCPQGPPLER